MKSIYIYLFMIAQLVFIGCNNIYPDTSSLRHLSRAEIIEFEKRGDQLFNENLLWFEERRPTPEEIQLLEKEELYYDIYVDNDNNVQLLKLRPATYNDNITEIIRKNQDFSPYTDKISFEFNCDSLSIQLEDVGIYREKSKHIRKQIKDSLVLDTFERKSFYFDRVVITSVEKKCGFESLDNKNSRRIWSLIHHNEKEILAYYFPWIEQQTMIGKLHPELLALATDRLLEYNGYKQVYGTQIVNSKLHPIRNVDSVNIRRAEIGLYSMSKYLKLFDVDTSTEMYRAVVSLDSVEVK